jgi:hypothetical protein
MDYKQKYLKYKSKYLALQQIGQRYNASINLEGGAAASSTSGDGPTDDEFADTQNWKNPTSISMTNGNGKGGFWVVSARYINNETGKNHIIDIYKPNLEMSNRWDLLTVINRMKYAKKMLTKYLIDKTPIASDFDPETLP